MKKQFIPSIHAFRAFAILNIVAIHAFEFIFHLAGNQENAPEVSLGYLSWGVGILFHDATLYFAFISGSLFTLVLADRGWPRFVKSKVFYVLLPYLIFTFLFGFSKEDVALTATEFIILFFKNALTGGAVFAYWYIPVLMVLYLFTPLFAKLLENKNAKWLVVFIVFSPLIFSRVWPEISWTNYAYFLGAYMLGMLVGVNYQKTIELLERHLMLFSSVAIIMTIALLILYSMESPKWGLIDFSESAWYLQKIAIAGLVLLFFERTLKTVPKWLDVLGNYAFTIYFLHAAALSHTYGLFLVSGVQMTKLPVILVFSVINFIGVILICVLLTIMFKKIFGRWSRYIIGA